MQCKVCVCNARYAHHEGEAADERKYTDMRRWFHLDRSRCWAMQGMQTMKAMQGYGMQGMHVLRVGVFVFVFCSSVRFAESSELGRARDFSRRVHVSGRRSAVDAEAQ